MIMKIDIFQKLLCGALVLLALAFSISVKAQDESVEIAFDSASLELMSLEEAVALMPEQGSETTTLEAQSLETTPLAVLQLEPSNSSELVLPWDRKLSAKELGLKYGGYQPLSEFEITPVPLIAFGLIAKVNKKNFRAARNNFIPSYVNRFDDFLQHVPLIATSVANIAGYEGRSNFKRYLVSGVLSYACMGVFVNGIKYTAKEMRPDGSTANSFPSGHTATAFVAATIMHKEYGQTRSPWWSVLGYGCATTTGIMRTLNNRHWISDILVGAGIGVISTDLGYALGDIIMKNRGIKRQKRTGMGDMILSPSFFRFSLGMQTHSNLRLPTECKFLTTTKLWDEAGAPMLGDDYYTVSRRGNPFRIPDNFNDEKPTYNNYATGKPAYDEGVSPRIKISTGTSVTAEGAYFVNPYIGVGLRGRITTAPAYAEGLYCYDETGGVMRRINSSSSASDVWSVADVGVGVYGAYPINSRHNIGGKVLYGRRFFGSLDLQAVYDINYKEKATGEIINFTNYGDNLYIENSNADNFTLGLHYTYSTNSGIALSAYVDYDFSRPEFDVYYTPYNNNSLNMLQTTSAFRYKQRMQSLNIGASMVVMF